MRPSFEPGARLFSAMISGLRKEPRPLARSLMRRFSPDLCTNSVWYRASGAHIFKHLLATEFELISLPRIRQRDFDARD
jgi:hypothetical protein